MLVGNHFFVIFADLDVSFAVNSCLNRSFFTFYYLTSNNSKMVQDRAIFTMADQYKVAYCLSNGAIFDDLDLGLGLGLG